MIRSLLVLAVLVLVAACTGQPAPGAASPSVGPTTSPDMQPTSQPTEEAQATSMPAATPTRTPVDYDYDYDYDRGGGYGGGRTPPAGDGDSTVAVVTYGDVGEYLVGRNTLALYTFDSDGPGSSSCSGNCAQTWPPLAVTTGQTPTAGPGIDGTLGHIVRADGSWQVTYDDAPLYYYAGDTALYDTTGDGVGGVWHLARP